MNVRNLTPLPPFPAREGGKVKACLLYTSREKFKVFPDYTRRGKFKASLPVGERFGEGSSRSLERLAL
jgi:hypothetical protein